MRWVHFLVPRPLTIGSWITSIVFPRSSFYVRRGDISRPLHLTGTLVLQQAVYPILNDDVRQCLEEKLETRVVAFSHHSYTVRLIARTHVMLYLIKALSMNKE